LQAFSNAIHRTFVQHFTRFKLTVCSHSSSALTEVLVSLCSACRWLKETSQVWLNSYFSFSYLWQKSHCIFHVCIPCI